MGTQPPAPPAVTSVNVAAPSVLAKKGKPVAPPLPHAPEYPSGTQLEAATQYCGVVKEAPTFSDCVSRHSSRFAPPPEGTLANVHAPAVISALAALAEVIAARYTRPPGAPGQLAPSSPPQPMGPLTADTKYVDKEVKVTEIAHT